MNEVEAKELLRGAGVAVPQGQCVTTATNVREVASRISFPLAIKGQGIAHKTEANAVILNVSDMETVEATVAELLTRCDSALIETMIEGGLVELIVGVTRDPVYGPMLTVGAGGVMAELLEDTATLLLPVSGDDIRAAISELKVSKLIEGYRGKPAADLDAAVSTIQAITRFAEAHMNTLEELDVNPLIVCEKGAFAADALIRMSEAHAGKVDAGFPECAPEKDIS